MPPGARTTLTGLISLALLAGCTSTEARPGPSDEPSSVVRTLQPTSPTPTPSATRTTTATATPASAPAPPPELSRTDEAGAAAAATYFVSLYSYMMQTGKTDEWAGMSAEPCGS